MSARMSTPCSGNTWTWTPCQCQGNRSESTCATSLLNMVMLKAELGGGSKSDTITRKLTTLVKAKLPTALDHSSGPRSPRET